uniref:KIAA1614 n=1 Tax=Moschus moschiferus TaxID=68415 RepID=A0A8C6E1K7_MOSMO
MEGMEAAARPAGGILQEPQIGSRTASSMEVTSAVERSGPEPQPENGHLPRPWPCPREDGTPSPKAPRPHGAPGIQLQGPSVLESKMRALKERMTAGKQGAGPGLTSHERPALKKPKGRRVKVGGTKPPFEEPSPPEAVVVRHTQNPNDRRLDRSITQEEPARNGDPRPPRSPAPGLECWSRRSPWPPEAVQTRPDHDRALPPGPSSLQEGPMHRVTPGRPGGVATHVPTLRKGRSHPQQDGLGTRGDLDSLSLTSEENFVLRPALLGELWKTGDLGALGTGGSTLSLSDRVERNRLLLQEMLSVGGQGLSKVGVPGWTSCWDRAVPERLAGDVDWDSGISLQDSDQSRTFGPKLEPVLSPRHEEAKHLLQRARMKARTRPVRASHDIVPTLALCSRDGRKSPALDPRMTFACRDNLQNGNTSDSSSGESSSGQWPKRGASPSHVRFEDESARDAESRYLERLQQRQRQVLGTADQGPLRSKPDLAYIQGGCRRRDAGAGALHPLLGGLQPRGLSAPLPPARGSERRCRACGHCIAPDPRVLQECEPACGREGASAQPLNSQGLSAPLRLLSAAEPRLHTEWIRETHIGEQALPEEADSALDSTDTSDSCRTDSEEAGTAHPGRARLRASRPRGGHRWLRKAEMEPPRSPQASHDLPGLELLEVSDEVTDGAGQTAGALLPREDAFAEPPVQDLEGAFPGSPWQPGPGLENHWAHPGVFRTAYAIASPMKLGSSGPGTQGPVIESQEPLGTDCPQQSHAEPSAPHQALQPTASLCPEGWVPTPPSSKKTASPVSHRKAALAGLRRLGNQGEPMDSPLPASRSAVPRTRELTPPQPQPHSPHSRHPLRALSTNNCNSSVPQGPQEPRGGAILVGETGAQSQEPAAPLEDRRDAVGTISSVGITFCPASEEPESSQEAEGGLWRTEPSSVGRVPSRASSGVSVGASPPSAAASDKNKKSSGGIASALGLKKFFSALSQGTRPKMGKSRSYSMEQLQPPVPGPASHTGTPKVKRAPSLQSLHLVSPSRQHRKATSFQNLHSLLSGKVDRSNLYLAGEPGDHSATDRPGKAPARRALSVEDVSAPGPARAVGRLLEVFPDGTSQLQLQRPSEGTFGFSVASGTGRRDSGFYVQEMADESTAKLYSGLLGVGDEILEVNGAKVAGLGLAHVRELLAHAESLSIRVLRQRPVPR